MVVGTSGRTNGFDALRVVAQRQGKNDRNVVSGFPVKGFKKVEGAGVKNWQGLSQVCYSTTSFKQAICGSYGLLSGHIGINRTRGYGTVPELLLDESEIFGVTVKQGSI